MRSFLPALIGFGLAGFATSVSAATLDAAVINDADPLGSGKASVIKLETLLDRANASPGAIDGIMDEVTERAIRMAERMNGLEEDGQADEALLEAISSGGDVAKSYEITEEDVGFELTGTIPETFAEMAEMERLGYQSYAEALAEKFHMSEALLKELNPDADFSKAGTAIAVVEPGRRATTDVARVEVDRGDGYVRGYDAGENLVFAAPATVGSEEFPSPSGTTPVVAVASMPTYTYEPGVLFGEAETDEAVVVPPGPNGPVGSMWIDLEKEGYGIHGTPYPSKISAMESHGCVRLTNWDAENLAQIVVPGETVVEFVGS